MVRYKAHFDTLNQARLTSVDGRTDILVANAGLTTLRSQKLIALSLLQTNLLLLSPLCSVYVAPERQDSGPWMDTRVSLFPLVKLTSAPPSLFRL